MKDRKLIVFCICGIIVMFSLLGYYYHFLNLTVDKQKQLFRTQPTTTSPIPDIIINQFVLNTPVKDCLAINITAAQAAIIRKNNTIHCLNVTSTITKDQKSVGLVTAKTAILDKQEKIITFFDAHGIMQDINLKGTCFVYNLASNLITSNQPLEIKTEQALFTGLNAKFDILKKHFTMEQVTTLVTLSSESQPIP